MTETTQERVGVETSRKTFGGGARTVPALVVRPEGKVAGPALILVHEWWGLNPHIEEIARRYAAEGYLVVAPDLYGGIVTTDPEEAGRLMSGLRIEDGVAQLQIVLAELRTWPDVTAVGVTGFCMGGTYALRLACEAKVDASAPFYGDLPEETSLLGRLDCPLLFIGGEKDAWITTAKMDQLSAALQEYGRDGEVKVYAGASHAFFNDTRPDVYSPSDAADAWKTVLAFLGRHLMGGAS
jgi:carboxymethylenebutenolidase